MLRRDEDSESALLRRWRRILKTDPKLEGEVRESASHILSDVGRFVAQRQRLAVEQIITDAARVHLSTGRPSYVS